MNEDLFYENEEDLGFYQEDYDYHYNEAIDYDDYLGEDAFGEDYLYDEPDESEARVVSRSSSSRNRMHARPRSTTHSSRIPRPLPRNVIKRPLQRSTAPTRPPAPTGPKYYAAPPPKHTVATADEVKKGFDMAKADVQATKKAVLDVDLDNQVLSKKVGYALQNLQKEVDGNKWNLAFNPVVDKIKDEFPDLVENQIIKTALPLLPLLFQKNNNKPWHENPVLPAAAASVAIAVFKEIQKKNKGSQGVKSILVTPPVKSITAGSSFTFNAVARDADGNVTEGKFEFASLDESIATVNDKTVRIAGAANPGDIVEIIAVETTSGLSFTIKIKVLAPVVS